MLLSTAYLPPIEYFALLAKEFTLSPDRVISSIAYIESKENYQKQSYRNRAYIYTDAGKQSLSYPIIHDGNKAICEIKIDYSTNWLSQHKRAITSAYSSSAYYEYYVDELYAIMDSKLEYLFDYNMALIKFFIEKFGLAVDLKLTDEYLLDADFASSSSTCPSIYGENFRDVVHPKRKNSILEDLGLNKSYYQVFSSKYGFIPNLSALDLLFNEGPNAILYLKSNFR